MATSSMSGVIQQVRRTVLLRDGAGMTDGQLLECFISRRDEAAFAALVRRQGPMVWAVCRRVLASHHDAEDAFQATFLVLVRRAASVLPRDMVANWLYGVAYQTALKARSTAARRGMRERQVSPMPEPAAANPTVQRDLQLSLDQELERLPTKYRAAIVLCDLEGKTRQEAARQLGRPEGTLSGWLTRGRALLAKRLTRRGVLLSGGALTALLSQQAASACPPASVAATTILAASLATLGRAAAGCAASNTAAVLVEGVLHGMLLTKLKTVAVVVLILGILAGGAGGLAYSVLGRPAPGNSGNAPVGAAPFDATEPAEQAPGQRIQPQRPKDGLLDLNQMWSRGRAVGKGPVRLTHAPMRIDDIKNFVPYGHMVGGHVTPIDHQYYYPKSIDPPRAVDIFAPADGFVVMIGHRVQLTGSTERKRDYDDFALTVEHSGTFYTFYDLLTELDAAILGKLDQAVRERFAKKGQGPPVHVRIPVKAGQVLGKVLGRSLDFAVINSETQLKGFLNPATYGHYAWRVHLVDPFDYYEEPIKGDLLKLNPRTAQPRGGKIDFDIEGRLAGNWFKEGTGGYPGTRDPRGYWLGHLAIVRHHLDTDKIIISIGDFDGRPRQFGVKGNGPDPAQVSKENGVVKYELINMAMPSSPRPFEGADGQVVGVVLLQVLDGRKLTVETFPGKTANEVAGFTKAALTYER